MSDAPQTTLSIEAMGGDAAPTVAIEGLALFCKQRDGVRFLLHGDREQLEPLVKKHPQLVERAEFRHTDIFVSMADKPSQALRKARGSSTVSYTHPPSPRDQRGYRMPSSA